MIKTIKSAFSIGAFALFGWNQALAFYYGPSGWNEVVKKSATWTNSASTVNYKYLKSNSKVIFGAI